jgi:hypothetical protein
MPKNSTLPSGSVWIKSADLNNQIVPGNTTVLLFNITLTGLNQSVTDMTIAPTSIDDDNGVLINPDVATGKVW